VILVLADRHVLCQLSQPVALFCSGPMELDEVENRNIKASFSASKDSYLQMSTFENEHRPYFCAAIWSRYFILCNISFEYRKAAIEAHQVRGGCMLELQLDKVKVSYMTDISQVISKLG
jgi:hypothetical protein